jgi:AraC family transcriptional regulator
LHLTASSAGPLVPVSTGRAVITREAGPFVVTLMEHRGDVRLERHRHQEAIVGLLLRGRYDERLDGRTVEPARASLLIKPPETPHANRIGSVGTDTILIQVLPNRIPDEHAALLSRSGIRFDERFFALGEEMRTELTATSDALGLDSLVNELLDVAARAPRPVGIGRSRRQAWLSRVRDALHESGNVSLATLAADAGVDRAHLARTFRAVHGCTIGAYVRALRMERAAARLAHSHDTIGRIAAELGFFDQAHFTRAFRAAYGATPRAWRRRIVREP